MKDAPRSPDRKWPVFSPFHSLCWFFFGAIAYLWAQTAISARISIAYGRTAFWRGIAAVGAATLLFVLMAGTPLLIWGLVRRSRQKAADKDKERPESSSREASPG